MEESENYKNVVIENNGDRGGINGFFRSVFLPRGYPKSVSKDYMKYQVKFIDHFTREFSEKNPCQLYQLNNYGGT